MLTQLAGACLLLLSQIYSCRGGYSQADLPWRQYYRVLNQHQYNAPKAGRPERIRVGHGRYRMSPHGAELLCDFPSAAIIVSDRMRRPGALYVQPFTPNKGLRVEWKKEQKHDCEDIPWSVENATFLSTWLDLKHLLRREVNVIWERADLGALRDLDQLYKSVGESREYAVVGRPNGSTLKLNNVSPVDRGLYRCIATAADPSTNAIFTLFQDVPFYPEFGDTTTTTTTEGTTTTEITSTPTTTPS